LDTAPSASGRRAGRPEAYNTRTWSGLLPESSGQDAMPRPNSSLLPNQEP